jgi:hypothetical protein
MVSNFPWLFSLNNTHKLSTITLSEYRLINKRQKINTETFCYFFTSRGGGMADTGALRAPVRKGVRVRLSPAALIKYLEIGE